MRRRIAAQVAPTNSPIPRWLVLSVLLGAPFLVFPRLDLAVAARVLGHCSRHVDRHSLLRWIHHVVPPALVVLAAVTVLGLLASVIHGRARITGRRLCGVALTFALGPGFLVPLMKRAWERPRPSEVQQLGGHQPFLRVLEVGPGCPDRCASFPSGDAAIGFAFVSLGLALESRTMVVGALLLGGALGAVRVAQGRHFPSDIVFTGLLIAWLAVWLDWRIGGPRRPRVPG